MHHHGALAHCWNAMAVLFHGLRVTPRPEGELAGDPTGLHPVCVLAEGLLSYGFQTDSANWIVG